MDTLDTKGITISKRSSLDLPRTQHVGPYAHGFWDKVCTLGVQADTIDHFLCALDGAFPEVLDLAEKSKGHEHLRGPTPQSRSSEEAKHR